MLAKAEERQKRRDIALQRLVQGRPEPPRGLLATFQTKAHEKAVAAWDEARILAGQLAQQAGQLVHRLGDLLRREPKTQVQRSDGVERGWQLEKQKVSGQLPVSADRARNEDRRPAAARAVGAIPAPKPPERDKER